MCCIIQDISSPETTYSVVLLDCCTIKLSNGSNTLQQTFNLATLDYEIFNGKLYLKDGVNVRQFDVATAPTVFGFATIADVITFLDASIETCKCPAAPVATPQIDIEHRTICNETTNTWHYVTVVYTGGVETSNTSLDSGIPCSDPLPLTPDIEQIRRCDVGTNTIWVDVVRYMTDPVLNVTTSSILESIDTLEKCNICKKEIFATHDRFISVPSIQPDFVGYQMSDTLMNYGLDVTNSYFHLAGGILSGNIITQIGPELTEYFNNPQNGIVFTNVAGIQAVIDFVLPSINLNVGDIVYAINTANQPIFMLSPLAVAEIANNTFLEIFWGGDGNYQNYGPKGKVIDLASNVDIVSGGNVKCVAIQEIKEKDSCTDEETYRYVIENLSGGLVPVTDLYPNFVEADVLLECKIVTVETKALTEQNHMFFGAGQVVDLALLKANSSLPKIHQIEITLASMDAYAELRRNNGNNQLGASGGIIIPIIMKFLDPLAPADYGVTSSDWRGINYNNNTLEECSDFNLNVAAGVVSIAWTSFKN